MGHSTILSHSPFPANSLNRDKASDETSDEIISMDSSLFIDPYTF